MNKMNKKRFRYIRTLTAKNYITIGILLLLCAHFMFLAFYSYAPLSRSQLKNERITISHSKIYTHSTSGRRSGHQRWITFSSDEKHRFYIRTDKSGIKQNDLVSTLESLRNKELTVYYTERRELHPAHLYVGISGDTRIAMIECDDEVVFNLDSYNKTVTNMRVNCIALASIAILCIPFIILCTPRIKKYKEKKKSNTQT